jgi:F-type H+-transporting ATPase subunit delta
MPAGASARRYAKAVFEIAVDSDELERWLDDLTQLADSITNVEFRQALSAPRISMAQKESLIRESLGEAVGPLALNLICLLASRGQVQVLPTIADRFQEMLDAHQGVERAEVVSAVSLTDAQQEQVTQMLNDLSGQDVRLTTRVDPEILGGLVIRIGDRVMDGSARSRLQNMRRELAQRR